MQDPWSSLTSPLRCINGPQARERPCLKTQDGEVMEEDT